MQTGSLFVTPDWVIEHLNDDNLVILDASMLQVVGRPSIEYERPTFLLCAIAFDLENSFVDPSSNLPHTLPSPERFTQLAQQLGINEDSHIVIYDNQGIYSSPRAWWMFKVMGHLKVSIMLGGLPAWLEKGYPTQMQPSVVSELGDFRAQLQPQWICSFEQVLQSIDDESTCIIDARASARFLGQAPEPRPGLRSGHIPSALNLPFLDIMKGDGYDSPENLTQAFKDLGVTPDQRLIFSCGSGITACILLVAALQVGYENLAVYDGSWAEWGANQNLPIE